MLEGLLFVPIALILGLLVQKERQKARALLEVESLTAVGKAVSEVAHDMKTPLMAIGGFVKQVARRMPEKDPDRNKLEIVIDETSRLEGMVRRMLDFGRPVELQMSQTDLNKAVRDVLEVASPGAKTVRLPGTGS